MKRQTLHFPFCQDLGNKKVIDIIWPEKINFALFKVKQKMDLGSGRTIPDTDIFLPGFYEVQKVNIGFWSSLMEDEYQTFIAPNDYSNSEIFYVREKKVKIDIPNEFIQLWKEQPHLIEHATFQFYFLNENLFSANLPFLRINDNNQIEVDWKIRATPSGTFLFFRSGHIFFKWKVEVRQKIINLNVVKTTIDAVMKTGKKIGAGIVKGMTMGAVDLNGDEDEAMRKLQEKAIYGQDIWEQAGLGKERTGKVQEQHTERLFKSTYADMVDKTVEASILYSNTITFPYNLFDYWLRNEKDPFFCRIYYSNNLYNNLVHNNNENPITYPLNITFEKLGNILRKGYYQGKLQLDYDPGGSMTSCFARGVSFYEDKEKEFPNPKLGIKEIADQIKYSATGGDSYTGQAITEGGEPSTVPVNRPKGKPYHQRGHYFIFYEDGSTEHWLAMYPRGDIAKDLPKGHTHGAFILEFDKPVKKMVDIYTCIGCGAQDTPLFEALHNNYRKKSNDGLEIIYKGLPFDPWYSAMSAATPSNYNLTVNGQAGRLGSSGDVWEKATQQRPDGKSFVKAYGYIPNSSTITWDLTDENSTRMKWQKQPGQDDFDNLDWNPPGGGTGEIEIPLPDPGFPEPEPGADNREPEPDFPTPDIDPTGGEPEISLPDIEITPDADITQDRDTPPDIDPPPVEIDPPADTDTSQDNDNDQDKGDKDPPKDDNERPEDFD